jgi:hypothetical protein
MTVPQGVGIALPSLSKWVDPHREPSSLEVEEVHRLGGRHSGARTADQTAAALFWSGNPLFPWTRVADALLAEPGAERHGARTLALITSMVSEALVMAGQLKILVNAPRPREYIHGEVGNAKRRHDPDWEPLLSCHHGSEFPCDGCVAAGVAVGALRIILGTDRAVVSVTGPWEDGLTRSYETLSQMLQESEDARVWGGLHFRTSVVESTEIGLRIGEAAANGHGDPPAE